MNTILKENSIPVFVINGFLEAGKTSFITYTLSAPYFHSGRPTLLIVCEEGETEYPERLLKREKVIKVVADSQDELSPEYFLTLDKTYHPDRVVIEYNGMWGDPLTLPCPEHWVLYQQISVMDGSTLEMYLKNMKPLMGPMLKGSELCIVNRCDNIAESKLLDFKRKLRPMLMTPGASLEMEDKLGPIELMVLDEELPYDVSAAAIDIADDDFGIWFIDARDYPERYKGKKVRFRAQIMFNRLLRKNEFIPVRLVMTCCEADMQPLGYIASYEEIDSFKEGEWVMLEADFTLADRDEYGGKGPYLKVCDMALTGPAAGPAGF